MTPEQFCYWLQGFAEIKGGWEEPTAQEWKVIKDHLELVFKKVTPTYQPPNSGFPGVRTLELRPGEGWPNWPPSTTITC